MRRLVLSLALVLALVATALAQSGSFAVLDRAFADALALLEGTDEARVAAEVASQPDPECFGDDVAQGDPARRRQLARYWRGRPVTWSVSGTRAHGLIGPPMPAMTTVCMAYERGAWRYAGFIPGD